MSIQEALERLRSNRAKLLEPIQPAFDEVERITSHCERTGIDPRGFTTQLRNLKAEIGRFEAEHQDELDAIDARMAELEVIEQRTKNAARATFNTGTGGGDPWAAEIRSDADARAVARSCIEAVDEVDDTARENLTQQIDAAERGSGALARWAVVASNPEYRSAFGKFLLDPVAGQLQLTDSERAAWAATMELERSMVVGTPSAGGYMVPFTLDPSILLTSAGAIDPMPSIARTVNITTGEWHGVSSAGVTSSWDAESEEVSDDTPSVAQPSIPVHGLRTFVPFSIEAEMDISDLLGELQRIIIDEMQVKEGTSFWTGSGTGQPRGLITALDAATGSEVATTTPEAFAVADVYKLHEALPARFRPNGVFAANIQVLNRARQFATGAGAQHAFLATLAEGSPPIMLGQRTYEASPMAPFTGANQNILAFFDPQRYVIVRRVGTKVELVPHLFGANRRPIGERGVFVYSRTGADLVTSNAGRLLQTGSAA